MNRFDGVRKTLVYQNDPLYVFSLCVRDWIVSVSYLHTPAESILFIVKSSKYMQYK